MWTPDALTTLMFLADATERIRVGSYVMCVDFHHPAVLARALLNLDELSDGRLEIGLGAGYIREEYEAAGIALASGATGLERLQETTAILKEMLVKETGSFAGRHFQLANQMALPRPVSSPGHRCCSAEAAKGSSNGRPARRTSSAWSRGRPRRATHGCRAWRPQP